MELHNTSYAIYLPAVNTGYVSTVANPLPQGRRFPTGLTPQDLMFWEPNNNWHYPYMLHSIGQYPVGKAPHHAMNKANRTQSTLVGDSGGYQIGKGTLNGLKYVKSEPMLAADAVEAVVFLAVEALVDDEAEAGVAAELAEPPWGDTDGCCCAHLAFLER